MRSAKVTPMIAERDSAMRAAPASVKRLLRSALAALLLASATPAAMAIDVTHVRVANIGVNQSINIGLNKSVIIDLPVDAFLPDKFARIHCSIDKVVYI